MGQCVDGLAVPAPVDEPGDLVVVEPTLHLRCHGRRSTLLAAAQHDREQVNGCSEHRAGVRKLSPNVHSAVVDLTTGRVRDGLSAREVWGPCSAVDLT